MRREVQVTRGTSSAAGSAAVGRLAAGGYWIRAEWAVIGMLAVVAVRLHELFPGLRFMKPVFTLSILGMILLLSHSAPALRSNVLRGRLSLLVYLYFGAICLTIPFALWHAAAVGTAQAMLPAILLFAAFQLVPPTRKTLDRLQLAFVVLVLFFAWYLQVYGVVRRGRLQSTGGTFDENDVASILAMTLPMAIALLLRLEGTKKRAAAGAAILATVAGVIATGSRGGFLALCASALVFVLGLNSAKAVIVAYFMALGAGAFWVTAPTTFKSRVRSLSNLENDYNMTHDSGRKAVWRRGRQYFRENPVLGVGAGNFTVAEGNWNDAQGVTGKWSAAHNAYIQAFAELGAIGGGIFVLMLLTAFGIGLTFWRRTYYTRGPPFHRPEFLAALSGYGVGAVFLSHAYFTPLFGVLGLLALATRVRAAERLRGSAVVDAEPSLAPIVQPPRGQRGGLALGTRFVAGP